MELEGAVAVVTGGGSGIGLGIAEELASAGARIVLADIEATTLDEAAARIREIGAAVLTVRTDVRRPEDLRALADRVDAELGGTDILCNNAGVLAPIALVWEATSADIEWTLAVNLWGAINGVHAFVPRMIDRATPAHIVNTASMAAIAPTTPAGSYLMSKGAMLALSESLALDLQAVGAPIGVSALLPEQVRSRLGSAARNRATADGGEASADWAPIWSDDDDPFLHAGEDPRVLGRRTVDAIREGRFWILPPRGDPHSQQAIERLHQIEAAFLD